MKIYTDIYIYIYVCVCVCVCVCVRILNMQRARKAKGDVFQMKREGMSRFNSVQGQTVNHNILPPELTTHKTLHSNP